MAMTPDRVSSVLNEMGVSPDPVDRFGSGVVERPSPARSGYPDPATYNDHLHDSQTTCLCALACADGRRDHPHYGFTDTAATR